MRATILPYKANILTKAHRAAVSTMANGCIAARVPPLRWLFFHYPAVFMFMQYDNEIFFIS